VRLLRDGGPMLRIGHRGAAALGPANSLEAIEGALAAGVDIVELDVFGHGREGLVLSHSAGELPSEPLSLDDALRRISGSTAGVQLDVKTRGVEAALVETIRRHDLLDRAFASTTDLTVLGALARLEPQLPRSVTYPRNRTRAAALARIPWALPARIVRLLAVADAAAATLQYRVVTRRVVERCHAFGAAVLAWTVNDRSLVDRLEAMGVDGVITDDPGIFRATLPG
jgi:glycerophosphoryl diester phosphodiesterase